MVENCRYCNTPLKEGYVAGNNVLWYTTEEPGFLMKQKDGNIKLNSSSSSWATVPAKHCSTCKTIIISYE
ncbi:MAG: PF20097 family protein [Candidatus Thorarchaeota archaeon]